MAQPAQIVSYDFGAHNAALRSGQHIHGNTWKKARTIMIIPSSATMAAKVALSHWNLIFPPNQGVYRMLVTGCEVGDAYSTAIEGILAHPDLSQWEYVLTVESDNIPPPDGVLKLIRRMEDNPHLSGIGGLYWCKGPGGAPHIWGDITDPVVNFRPVMPRTGELIECYGTSMGFNLWRLEMFKDQRIARRTATGRDTGRLVGLSKLVALEDVLEYRPFGIGQRFAVHGFDALMGALVVGVPFEFSGGWDVRVVLFPNGCRSAPLNNGDAFTVRHAQENNRTFAQGGYDDLMAFTQTL